MRDIPVGNGCLHVNFDDKYQIRDIYFPHVGQENHTEGYPSRFGVWVDGGFSWIASDEWTRRLEYLPETLVTNVTLTCERLGVTLICNDTVASHDNIYIRRIIVRNDADHEREFRIFLHHDLRIYENKVGDTAFYDPETQGLIHYKKHRYFLISSEPHFDSFATGRKAFLENEGTWRDAEDGELHGGVTTEGSVDSTIRIRLSVDPNETSEIYYWVCVGTSHARATHLHRTMLTRSPGSYFESTSHEWRAWVNKDTRGISELGEEIAAFYKRSLLIINTQIDDDGAILAANDHDVTARATDHYSYLWTRDGAFVANALDRAGYGEISRRFFNFCCKIIHEKGYFLQKYNPDGTVASGWHPSWDVYHQRPLVPIQEDETALVLWALWEHYDKYRDIDFALRADRVMVERAAEFMVGFRDPETKLPLPSWNLWEDRRGVHTFTCASVVAGLRAAAKFAEIFNKEAKAVEYRAVADEIVDGMRQHLYKPDIGRFLRGLLANGDDDLTPDPIVDASLFAIFYFGCFDVDDAVVKGTMDAIVEHLGHKSGFGGIARFENDGYMRTSDGVAGNSWFICTLWLAEYRIAGAKTVKDLDAALEILRWVTQRALPSGVLAEQIDPVTGAPTSVSPLTWSHSTFVAAVHSLLDKKRELEA
jgi:glucoamylase